MKHCPTCQATYTDDSLNFCLQDGAALIAFDSQSATVVLDSGSAEGASAQKATARLRGPSKSKAINSLAVLPFENVSKDPNTEYLSEGITENIINSLSRLPRLKMMARSTVFRYKGQAVDPQRVGRDLDVRAVLTGRVLQLGDDLIVGAELVKVADGSQLWGEQYKRKLSDIFEVQDEIAREISEKLRLKLTGRQKKQLTKRYTDNSEAYHLYMKGRYHQNKWTAEGIEKSIEHFNQAIAIDPTYALAYAGLADSYASLGAGDILALSAMEAAPKARAAAIRALEIDNTLAEAHTSLGLVKLNLEWDWQGAERAFKRALELNRNYVPAYHWYSHYFIAMGHIEESLALSRRALELDILDLEINVHLAWHYYFARDYDRAIERARKTLEMDSKFVEAYWFLGRAYEQMRIYDQAIATYEKAMALQERSAESIALLGHAHGLAGNNGEARKLLSKLKDESKRRYVSPYWVAIIYLGLSEKDKAFEWLRKAYGERDPWLAYLNVNPIFDMLRLDSRFVDLVQRVGLPQ
jgi:TolB-like protein/Tfp pilus assembly protein PilF